MFGIVITIHTAGHTRWAEELSWPFEKIAAFSNGMEKKEEEKGQHRLELLKGQPANTDWPRTQQPTPPLPHLLNVSY